jgi:hypothetical protein
MGRDRKDASPYDIGTYSHEGNYWYGTHNILANGTPNSQPALAAMQLAPPGALARGSRRRILALQ